MGVAKVILNNETLIDVTQKTVTSSNLLNGITALGRDGESVVGSYIPPVVPMYQSKTVTPTSSTQVVVPDSGYDALSSVTVNPIPSDYVIPAGTLSVLADGIYDVKSYASVSVSVGGGGGQSGENTLVMRAYTSYTNNEVSYIGPYAFAYHRSLVSVSFANCEYIGSQAFTTCSLLSSISFPAVSLIGSGAFYACSGLQSIDFPELTYIEYSAFRYCSGLQEINLSKVSQISAYAFAQCASLRSVTLDSLERVITNTFSGCSSLQYVSMPAASYIGASAFRSLSALEYGYFPSCTSVQTYAFQGCTKLSSVILNTTDPLTLQASAFYNCGLSQISFRNSVAMSSMAFMSCTSLEHVFVPKLQINGNATGLFMSCTNLRSAVVGAFTNAMFISCTNLSAVYYVREFSNYSNISTTFDSCIRLLSLYLFNQSYSSIVSVASTAFVSTPIGGYTDYTDGVYGNVFVPASLYNSYITDGSWAYFSSRIVSMTSAEESEILQMLDI